MKRLISLILVPLLALTSCAPILNVPNGDAPNRSSNEFFVSSDKSDGVATVKKSWGLTYEYKVIGDCLYIPLGMSPGMARLNMTTGNVTTLCTDPLCGHNGTDCPFYCTVTGDIFIIGDGYMIFGDSDGINICDVNLRNRRLLVDARDYHRLIGVVGTRLYYTCGASAPYGFASVDIAEGGAAISERLDIGAAIQLTDKYLYYYKYDEEQSGYGVGVPRDIWRCEHDGSSPELVLSGKSYAEWFMPQYIVGDFICGNSFEKSEDRYIAGERMLIRLSDGATYMPDMEYVY